MTDTHECPVNGCTERVMSTMLMCRRHWYMIPPEMGRRLYRAYDRGRGALSDAHAAAMQECIDYVNEREASPS